MNRNILYLLLGALLVTSAVMGYSLYQERQKKDGFNLSIGSRGISVEKK